MVQECSDSIVINSYTPVIAFDPCKNRLTVSDASEFHVGDTVLLMQMQGAEINTTNTSSLALSRIIIMQVIMNTII